MLDASCLRFNHFFYFYFHFGFIFKYLISADNIQRIFSSVWCETLNKWIKVTRYLSSGIHIRNLDWILVWTDMCCPLALQAEWSGHYSLNYFFLSFLPMGSLLLSQKGLSYACMHGVLSHKYNRIPQPKTKFKSCPRVPNFTYG